MEVIIKPDAGAVSKAAARIFQGQIERKATSVLGLATGTTPLGLYRELAVLSRAELVDFSRATTFLLDEYAGIPRTDPKSNYSFVKEHLFAKVNLPIENMHAPDGMARDVPKHCADYEAAIKRAGGIDLQLLGIGVDGHLGGNEPTSSLASRTRLKAVTPRMIEENATRFGGAEKVPRHAITMGIATIMEARDCLVLALGEAKARAVAAMIEGPLAADCPASALQMHPRVTVIIDEAAATCLRRGEYYRWAEENKPAWQRM